MKPRRWKKIKSKVYWTIILSCLLSSMFLRAQVQLILSLGRQ
jgi:hypothetical protein